MRNKKIVIFSAAGLLVAAILILKSIFGGEDGVKYFETKAQRGTVESIITTTGTVLPKNRLEIKPPVNGRIESILVKEGEKVKEGQTLAWMSSTERAALLDAAREQGADELKYWKTAYRPIALISPIDGEVIVAKMQPGQTVTTSEAVVVLSDHLIIRSQVDETDIGKIKLGQSAFFTLDAFPETRVDAMVEHIYYESKTVNNVTIYEVDLNPEAAVPDFIRSGMNASVNFITESKENALYVLPEAVMMSKEGKYVLVKNGRRPVERPIEAGVSGEEKIEVVSGINEDDIILVKSKKFALPQGSQGSNPFMPFGKKKEEKK